MKIPPVKGTRDFYPEDMAKRNFIVDGWKKVSIRNGFAEFDGPIFEYLAMYQQKSGDEIASQLFAFEDRGERMLAIRPEITPTLARMVNQRINALPRPIKWFSVPRLCRAERPQKGRLREFFQWNIDIIGVDDCLADAEVIFCAVDYLKQAGLTDKDVVVKISSRKMLAAFLKSIGVAEEKLMPLYALLDKKKKLPTETFYELLNTEVPDKAIAEQIKNFMNLKGAFNNLVKTDDQEFNASIDEMTKLFNYLDIMGIKGYYEFDPAIVRGLAYYTGVVFEIYDRSEQLRAICGGGRYDNLLSDFGGPKVSATGCGMGDCVLGIVLEEKGLFKNVNENQRLDYFVAYADDALQNEAIGMAAKLRSAGKKTDFSYKGGGLGKQLKQASTFAAAKCVIVGQEYLNKQLVVKDMAKGEQVTISESEFLKQIEE